MNSYRRSIPAKVLPPFHAPNLQQSLIRNCGGEIQFLTAFSATLQGTRKPEVIQQQRRSIVWAPPVAMVTVAAT